MRVPSVDMRWVAMLMLICQTVASIIILRLSRVGSTPDKLYIKTVAVVNAEMLKLLASVVLVCRDESWNLQKTAESLKLNLFNQWREFLKAGIPATLYVFQNWLIFEALSHLSGAIYQVSYQLKILTTALFGVIILRRSYATHQWIALTTLTVGVALIGLGSAGAGKEGANDFRGFAAVFAACMTSGLAGVTLEKLLKDSSQSIWIRNIQLATYGVVVGLAAAWKEDGDVIARDGFYRGFTTMACLAVAIQAFGGIAVALVLKYADNILKCFANATGIILSSVASYYIVGDFTPTMLFCAGATLVVVATWGYSVGFTIPQGWLKDILVGDSVKDRRNVGAAATTTMEYEAVDVELEAEDTV
eukprot:GHVU01093098.1.p1 GENE.GHVU01093098.1~~GHVU01093098.1.p1  ORF type:complete len:361 (+),score=27.86 GHVU01093098.1:310-1392(+)